MPDDNTDVNRAETVTVTRTTSPTRSKAKTEEPLTLERALVHARDALGAGLRALIAARVPAADGFRCATENVFEAAKNEVADRVCRLETLAKAADQLQAVANTLANTSNTPADLLAVTRTHASRAAKNLEALKTSEPGT